MNGHHLILGEISDFVTGETLPDTHDERYRQKLARFLIGEKRFRKREIVPRREIIACAGEKRAVIRVDFVILGSESAGMMVKYGPGSLVTRRRPALAASRLIEPYQIPVVVVTNGEDAEIIAGHTGDVFSTGLDSIPDREKLAEIMETKPPKTISPDRQEKESRILYAYEVDGACPCDDTICRL